MAAASDDRKPEFHERHFMDYMHKHGVLAGPDYVRRSALMIQREYPEHAGKVLPELRELYRLAKKKAM